MQDQKGFNKLPSVLTDLNIHASVSSFSAVEHKEKKTLKLKTNMLSSSSFNL